MAGVILNDVVKIFEGGVKVVDRVTLEIADREFVVLVGPSGCGKSTTLRMIAGLEEITSGTISIGGNVVNDVPPKDRDIAMVFQSYALYPHMTVYENMAFALKLRRLDKVERDRRVRDAAAILGLSDLLERRPKALSGGQRQRVAMGRAIVREPRAFLMDEPLSNLDAKLRVQMRAEIARIQGRLGTTTVYVTHDQTEAMTMGDRVAILRDGRLQQVDVPKVLYDSPANLFVAGFIGSPAMNMVEADVADDATTVAFGPHKLELDPALLERRSGVRRYAGRQLIVGLRPEDLEDAEISGESRPGCLLRAVVELTEALGSEVLVHFPSGAPPVMNEDTRALTEDLEGPPLQEDEGRFVARLDPRTRARTGEPIELSVDTARLHLFDPSTGLAIFD
jgi:multiple sugar transport system ATP-binding protein